MDPAVCFKSRRPFAGVIRDEFTAQGEPLIKERTTLGEKLDSRLLDLIRFYTLHFPVRRGKYRLMAFARRLFGDLLVNAAMPTRDGRRFYVDQSSSHGMYDTVYFMGEYEPVITSIITALVREGDLCLDIGANFGWYTTLLSRSCGESGSVHAFEPVPAIFEVLKKNVSLAGQPSNVYAINLAIGDVVGKAVMHVFSGLPNGHSSLSTMGRSDYEEIACLTMPLDAYVADRQLGPVQFAKCDVEGAELLVLKGAQSVLRQSVPPIWIIEMAKGTSSSFGYLPNDLIVYMNSQAEYEFYVIDEAKSSLRFIRGFDPDDIGANVLCVPVGQFRDRLDHVRHILAAAKH